MVLVLLNEYMLAISVLVYQQIRDARSKDRLQQPQVIMEIIVLLPHPSCNLGNRATIPTKAAIHAAREFEMISMASNNNTPHWKAFNLVPERDAHAVAISGNSQESPRVPGSGTFRSRGKSGWFPSNHPASCVMPIIACVIPIPIISQVTRELVGTFR